MKKPECELDNNLQFYRFALERLGDAVLWHGPDARIKWVNEAACEQLGYSRAELLAATVYDFVVGATEASYLENWAHLKKVKIVRFEDTHRHKSGRIIPVEVTLNYLAFEGREFSCAMARDITERKNTENELNGYRLHLQELVQEKTADLHQANQELKELNELKNKFLGIASHDLRNPLYMIHSFSEILKDAVPGPVNEKQHEMLEKVLTSSRYMKSLLENLLDISKIESGKIELQMESQDLNGVIRQQVEFNQFLAEKKGIGIEFVQGDVPLVEFDASAIIQIAGNLIGNAVKFSPLNTRIVVKTQAERDRVRFSVKDEGPGISAEDQKLLFGEFQRLSAKPTGGEKSTGLGLAITRKLAQLHQGGVGVESEPGKGSTFFLDLPLKS